MLLRIPTTGPQGASSSLRMSFRAALMASRSSNGQVQRYSQASQASRAPGPRFRYLMGASASAKPSRLGKAHHGQNYWIRNLALGDPPFFHSVQKHSGEDAFFMSHIARSDRHVIFGVADGVGGWQNQGISPADFSHGLCRWMAEITYRPEQEQDLKPSSLLQKGYERVLKDRGIVAGGSTAAIAAMHPDGNMEFANLGDSGFVILQPGKVAYMSEPQTHAFNTPYQLSKLSSRMEAQRHIFGGSTQIAEHPAQANVTNHTIRHGDVVLVATDGVWDNLSAMDILSVISPIMVKAGHWTAGVASHPRSQEAVVDADSLRSLADTPQPAEDDLPGTLAYAVMRQAKLASLDTKRDGPFAKEVHRHYPDEDWHGGKVDDICVVVSVAVQDSDAPWKPKAKL